jgi:hypothetical protein
MSDEKNSLPVVSQPVLDDKNASSDDGTGSKPKSLKTIEEKYADITLRLVEEYGHTFEPMTPAKEQKLKNKLYLHITLLVLIINLVLFVS